MTLALVFGSIRQMSVRFLFLPLLACLFVSCSFVRDGVIVAKKSRRGLANVYQTGLSFRYEEPDVYWVRVEGRDQKGRRAHKDIILFRHDWEQLRVGDKWDRQRGFAPGEADK